MGNYKINNDKILVDDNFLKVKKIDDLLLIFLEIPKVNPNKAYTNVIAIDIHTGLPIWRVEEYYNPKEETKTYKTLGPFLDAVSYNQESIILTKAHGWKTLINKKTGEVVKNIDLNTKSRPW